MRDEVKRSPGPDGSGLFILAIIISTTTQVTMKTIAFFVFFIFYSLPIAAQMDMTIQEITANIIKAATHYSNAVACGVGDITAKDIAALSPYKSFDDREKAEYAALWEGDIGCSGGSGSSTTNISIVKIGEGGSFLIDPSRSSPIINFSAPVRYISKIVGNTRDTLILEGLKYGEKDSNCCPSIPVRFTLKLNKNGNWDLLSLKTITRQGITTDAELRPNAPL